MSEVTPDGTIVLKMTHPATHPSRKVRTVGPLVDLWLDREPVDLHQPKDPVIRSRPVYAGPDRQDRMWTYVLGRVRPEVELTAWLLASRWQPAMRTPTALPAGIDKPCATIPCPPIMHTDHERTALKAAWFRTSREPIEYR